MIDVTAVPRSDVAVLLFGARPAYGGRPCTTEAAEEAAAGMGAAGMEAGMGTAGIPSEALP